jgi:hypothetical protein
MVVVVRGQRSSPAKATILKHGPPRQQEASHDHITIHGYLHYCVCDEEGQLLMEIVQTRYAIAESHLWLGATPWAQETLAGLSFPAAGPQRCCHG